MCGGEREVRGREEVAQGLPGGREVSWSAEKRPDLRHISFFSFFPMDDL